MKVQVQSFLGKAKEVELRSAPDLCPRCKRGINAVYRIGFFKRGSSHELDTVWQCPIQDCGRLFIAESEYLESKNRSYPSGYSVRRLVPVTFTQTEFGEEVESISPRFIKVFNQAASAEAQGLDEISGQGYGKALEILVKDFAVSEKPDDADKIKKEQLGQVIKAYIKDEGVQAIAERAAWLRNDEAHYERRWLDKDVEDLKVLIRLVVNDITNAELRKKYVNEMPKS